MGAGGIPAPGALVAAALALRGVVVSGGVVANGGAVGAVFDPVDGVAVDVVGAFDVGGVAGVAVLPGFVVDDGVGDAVPVVPTAPGVAVPCVVAPGWPGRAAPAMAPDVSGFADRVLLSFTAVSGTQGE